MKKHLLPLAFVRARIQNYLRKPKMKQKLLRFETYVQSSQKAFAVGSACIFLTTLIVCLMNYYTLPYWAFALFGYVLLLEMLGVLIWLCLENRTLFGSFITGCLYSIIGIEFVLTVAMIDQPTHEQFIRLLTQVGILYFVFGAGVSLIAQLGVGGKKKNLPQSSM